MEREKKILLLIIFLYLAFIFSMITVSSKLQFAKVKKKIRKERKTKEGR